MCSVINGEYFRAVQLHQWLLYTVAHISGDCFVQRIKMVMMLASYIIGFYNLQRKALVIIVCSVHQWLLYCIAYNIVEYTVHRTYLDIVLSNLHQWWLYCAAYMNGDYTVQCISMVIILCSVHEW